MSRHVQTASSYMLILLLAVGTANVLVAQEADLDVQPKDSAPTITCESLDDDSPYPLGYEETLALAIQAIHIGRAQSEKDDRKCFFRMGEALARHLVFERRNDPEPRYWYAAAMGLRAVEEGGGTQVSLGERAHEQARLVLTIAPDHAGAQHILGRLHAAVMRLSGFKRFIATQILGGKTLSKASWESAESFLTAAATLQPEVPDHHLELGKLYMDTDRPEAALAAFERALTCPTTDPVDRAVQAQAEEMLARVRLELAV
jgi:tetratricopeptide (TPR) repeat protein